MHWYISDLKIRLSYFEVLTILVIYSWARNNSLGNSPGRSNRCFNKTMAWKKATHRSQRILWANQCNRKSKVFIDPSDNEKWSGGLRYHEKRLLDWLLAVIILVRRGSGISVKRNIDDSYHLSFAPRIIRRDKKFDRICCRQMLVE
jgi:hypothetical protein